MSELPRSRRARELAQEALVRLVAAYGTNPRFVLLGGLVPDLLCTRSQMLHIGTTDIDLQVNLEIYDGSPNVARLETALRASGFSADS
ncbi:MAG: hypothetical protein DCC49_05090 [Acidobacteria bacterium]|nr:MAG: hypothetical protein DCC49_05090 [Acidobacteriota bacterium]